MIQRDFPERCEVVFTERIGPLVVPRAGHFLQWERADLLNQCLIYFLLTGERVDLDGSSVLLTGATGGIGAGDRAHAPRARRARRPQRTEARRARAPASASSASGQRCWTPTSRTAGT